MTDDSRGFRIQMSESDTVASALRGPPPEPAWAIPAARALVAAGYSVVLDAYAIGALGTDGKAIFSFPLRRVPTYAGTETTDGIAEWLVKRAGSQ
jgi:uncharacterized membrane protein